jgi:type II secretion system protein H
MVLSQMVAGRSVGRRVGRTCQKTALLQKSCKKPAILTRRVFLPYYGGFTLVELLVVLVILSVMIGLVAVNYQGGETRRASNEQALLALFENARDHAVSEGVPVAVSFSLAGEPLVRERSDGVGAGGANRWTQSTALATPNARFTVRELRLAGQVTNASQAIVFSPEGLTTPFAVTLAQADSEVSGGGNERRVAVITGDRLGRIEMKPL